MQRDEYIEVDPEVEGDAPVIADARGRPPRPPRPGR